MSGPPPRERIWLPLPPILSEHAAQLTASLSVRRRVPKIFPEGSHKCPVPHSPGVLTSLLPPWEELDVCWGEGTSGTCGRLGLWELLLPLSPLQGWCPRSYWEEEERFMASIKG